MGAKTARRLARVEFGRFVRDRRTWMLFGVTALLTALFGFLLLQLVASLALSDPSMEPVVRQELVGRVGELSLRYLPLNLARSGVELIPFLAVTGGGQMLGADYRSGLARLVVGSGVRRDDFMRAKIGCQGIAAIGGGLVMAIALATCSAVSATDNMRDGPEAGVLVCTIGVCVLAWWTFATLGMLLTVAVRSVLGAFCGGAVLFLFGSSLMDLSGRGDAVGRVLSGLPLAAMERGVLGASGGDWGSALVGSAELSISLLVFAWIALLVFRRQSLGQSQ